MIQDFLHYIRTIILWLLFFTAAKLFFFGVNGGDFSLSTFFTIWKNGVRLDFSVIGYLTLIPLTILALQTALSKELAILLRVYWWVVFVFVLLVVAVDPYFFSYWGQKTNLGFIQFLGKENAGMASIEVSTYIGVAAFVVLAVSWFAQRGITVLLTTKYSSVYGNVLLICISVVLLRGGFGKVPVNLSSAYFSENNVHNNTAINAVWNFLATEIERDKHAPLVFFDDESMLGILELEVKSYPTLENVLKINDSTNVVLVVLESFSAKVIGNLSGSAYDATPQLNQLMEHGVNFRRAFASSFRSDKGLLGLTYGVPSGARQTLTNFPQHLAHRRSVFSVFPDTYHTSFGYGGNLEFANISVLFKDANKVKSQDDYQSTNANVWGVHDEEVFRQELEEFVAQPKPQFRMIFSLSSHEPFDVPHFEKNENDYLNSVAYTDSCLGVFVAGLKSSGKWGNTLLIITADHGSIRPDNAPIYDTANFKIPLLLTGGAVLADTSVRKTVSQLNLLPTLAHLFGDSHKLGNSLLSPQGRAFYSYHNGLVFVSDSTLNIYDIGMKAYIKPPQDKPYEKAFFQQQNKAFFAAKH